jgi:hypothetical protein
MRATATILVNIGALLPANPPVNHLAVDPVEECPVLYRRRQFRLPPLSGAYPARMVEGATPRDGALRVFILSASDPVGQTGGAQPPAEAVKWAQLPIHSDPSASESAAKYGTETGDRGRSRRVA